MGAGDKDCCYVCGSDRRVKEGRCEKCRKGEEKEDVPSESDQEDLGTDE